jgi:hypothetical protein
VTIVKSVLVVKRERHLCINTEARCLIYTLMSLKNNREKKCVMPLLYTHLEREGDAIKFYLFSVLALFLVEESI